MVDHALMNKQRVARLAQEARMKANPPPAKKPVEVKPIQKTPLEEFTMAPEISKKNINNDIFDKCGPDSCHEWVGNISRWPDKNESSGSYVVGTWTRDDGSHVLAHRATVEEHFGIRLTKALDIIPICSSRTCCNIRHLAATPRGKGLALAIPVLEYFDEGKLSHALYGKQSTPREGNHCHHVQGQEAGSILR